jgi:tRNA(Ile)-lysidine synthase
LSSPLLQHLADQLANAPPGGLCVAFSGGPDSTALLHALAALPRTHALRAIHVDHALHADSAQWASHARAFCAALGVPCTVLRVAVDLRSGRGIEAAAREARYAAIAGTDADFVALGHHADDQAETVLLQLLRGAGPHGLAAMAARAAGEGPRVSGDRRRARVDASGRPIVARMSRMDAEAAARAAGEGPRGPTLVRPLLGVTRAAIDAHARRHGLAWIDDESNEDPRHRRNYLRREIAPRLAPAFPGYPATLVRAAAHAAEAAGLVDTLAAIDAAGAGVDADDPAPTLERAALVALAAADAARARNLLRWFLRRHGLPPPSTARLGAMLDQLLHAPPDARVRLAHAGAEIGVHRARIAVHPPPVAPYEVRWNGEPALALPHGTLLFRPSDGDGLALGLAAAGSIIVRPLRGGEVLRLAANRPRRPVKRLFQEAGIPSWERAGWPLVWCGEALAAIPGIGVAVEFAAPASSSGYAPHWRPRAWNAQGPR